MDPVYSFHFICIKLAVHSYDPSWIYLFHSSVIRAVHSGGWFSSTLVHSELLVYDIRNNFKQ